MTKVVKLFAATKDARHWSAFDVLNDASLQLRNGTIPPDSHLIVLYVDKNSEDVNFVQNGLCSFSIIALLEIAKLHIYRKFIAKD